MSAVDHVAEAKKSLAGIVWANDETENKEVTGLEALTHATLALVEQQRIANLIAIHDGKLGILAEISPDPSKRTLEENDRRWRNMRAIREQIREGLGIA